MLPLVYHDDYSPPFPANHRFPMEKFRLLRDHLVDSGLVRDGELHRPEICPADVLALAHCPAYIERFASGELTYQEQRRLGLPWSEAQQAYYDKLSTLSRDVAIKQLRVDLASDPTFQARFRAEATLAAKLHEPHIIPIHDFGEIDGRPYVTMRLIDGKTIDALVTNGPLAPPRAV